MIRFERSIKPDEMDELNKTISLPLQNDAIFYDGVFLFRCGLNSTTPFSEKYLFFLRSNWLELSALFVSQDHYSSMLLVISLFIFSYRLWSSSDGYCSCMVQYFVITDSLFCMPCWCTESSPMSDWCATWNKWFFYSSFFM